MSKETATLQQHQQALLTLLIEFDRVCKELNISYILFAGTLLGAVRHKGFIPWDDDLDVMMLREDYERLLQEADRILDREKFYLQGEFSAHWTMFFSKLRLNGTTCLEKYHPKDSKTHQGVYIDIFPCDSAAKSKLGRLLQFYCSKVVIAKGLSARGYDTDSNKKKLFMGLCRLLPRKLFHQITAPKGRKTDTVHSFFGGASKFEKNIYPRSYFEKIALAEFEGHFFPIPEEYDALLTTLYGDYMTMPPIEERKCKEHTVLVDLNCSYEEYEHYRDGMKFEVYTRSIR